MILWTQLAAAAHVELSARQMELFEAYLDRLADGNQRMNLTRIVDRDAARVLHVGDALTLLPFLPRGEIRIADVGSGGGVPGLILAIARPEAWVTCIESTKKKALFLQETAAGLGLRHVHVSPERSETLGEHRMRKAFDVATARALGNLSEVARFCLPLLKHGGKLLAMKGPKVMEELPTAKPVIRRLGGGKPVIHPVQLPGAEGHVVVEVTIMGGRS